MTVAVVALNDLKIQLLFMSDSIFVKIKELPIRFIHRPPQTSRGAEIKCTKISICRGIRHEEHTQEYRYIVDLDQISFFSVPHFWLQ